MESNEIESSKKIDRETSELLKLELYASDIGTSCDEFALSSGIATLGS